MFVPSVVWKELVRRQSTSPNKYYIPHRRMQSTHSSHLSLRIVFGAEGDKWELG